MKGTKYLSELVDCSALQKGQLNVIKAPTGSGKTYFALNYIPSLTNADNIVEHYENEGDPYEIKAVYRDLHDLEKIEGITLHYDGRTKGWWMEREGLTPNELRLIVDSIQASKFITQERARAITGKVLKLTDRHTRASLNRQSYVAGRVRSMNDSVVDEADKLHEAIASNSKVSFRYFHYTPSKERQYSKSGERYIVSPYALQWNDGNYYLYALSLIHI